MQHKTFIANPWNNYARSWSFVLIKKATQVFYSSLFSFIKWNVKHLSCLLNQDTTLTQCISILRILLHHCSISTTTIFLLFLTRIIALLKCNELKSLWENLAFFHCYRSYFVEFSFIKRGLAIWWVISACFFHRSSI